MANSPIEFSWVLPGGEHHADVCAGLYVGLRARNAGALAAVDDLLRLVGHVKADAAVNAHALERSPLQCGVSAKEVTGVVDVEIKVAWDIDDRSRRAAERGRVLKVGALGVGNAKEIIPPAMNTIDFGSFHETCESAYTSVC